MNKKKKLCFITPLYMPAEITGSGMLIKNVAEYLQKNNYDITVVTSSALDPISWYDPFFSKKLSKHTETINSVKVVRLSCNQLISSLCFIFNKMPLEKISKALSDKIFIYATGPYLNNLKQYFQENDFDNYIISPFPLGLCYQSYKILTQLNKPYSVIPLPKYNDQTFINIYLQKILDHAKSVYATTEIEKNYLIDTFHVQAKKLFIFPSTIDLKAIKKSSKIIIKKAAVLKEKLKLQQKKIILYMGTKGAGKGAMDLVKAHSLLPKDIVLILIGNPTRQWKKFINNYKNPNILDLAYQKNEDKYAFLSLCSILVLPSLTDNFPTVFLEAWSLGKPVVSYDFYSMKEILKNNTGILAKKSDTKDLKNKIQMILSNKTNYETISLNARNEVLKYDLPVVTKLFLKGL